jgi:hypothetical protein
MWYDDEFARRLWKSNNTENLLLSQNVAYIGDLALFLCPVQLAAHPQGAQ